MFINFVDHGGPGVIAFPRTLLKATALNQALTFMYQNNMYKELLFYVEACESGQIEPPDDTNWECSYVCFIFPWA